jgi:hypothetical protein
MKMPLLSYCLTFASRNLHQPCCNEGLISTEGIALARDGSLLVGDGEQHETILMELKLTEGESGTCVAYD